jgi:Arc/MetJ-type ribon-helix-helix transcriptional regulator
MIEEHELEKIRSLVEDGELDDASALLKRLVIRAPTHEELRALRVELRCRVLARVVAGG